MAEAKPCSPGDGSCVDLEEGDIVFYLPQNSGLDDLARDVETGLEEQKFQSLAGYVESFPYAISEDCDLPLVHVEVYVGDNQYVGFRGDAYTGSESRLTLGRGPSDFGSRRWVARFRDEEVGACVKRESLKLLGTGSRFQAPAYASDSLLAFAMATNARMKPEPLRSSLMFQALGTAELAVRSQQAKNEESDHMSCVTAVIKALEKCDVGLAIEEPPAIEGFEPLHESVDSSLGRLVPGMANLQAGFTLAKGDEYAKALDDRLDALVAMARQGSGAVDTIAELEVAVLDFQQLLVDMVSIWGKGVTSAAWWVALAQARQALENYDPNASLTAMALSASPEAQLLLTSPAMLWRALEGQVERFEFTNGVGGS